MKIDTAKITRIALSVAFTVVGAQLAIPTIPPITLQTLCIFITAVILKPSEAVISSFIYILLGAVGVPVFSGFQGGLSVILNVGGGFIISFPLVAFISSYLSRKYCGSLFTDVFTFSVATLVSYIFGALWIQIMGYCDTSFIKMLTMYILPFIPFDAVKIALSAFCVIKLKKVFNRDKKQLQNNKAQKN